MTSRLARKRATVFYRLAGRLNRIHDPAVAGAAADMAVKRLGDGLAVVRLPLLNQRCSPDDDARDAEPALDSPFEDERFADDSPRRLRKAFELRDHVAGP